MAEYFFDNKKPLIPIVVTLNGRKGLVRVEGIIDTGSTFVVIPPEVAETLGYEIKKAEKVEVATPEGLKKVPVITLDEVSVMGQMAPRVKATILPFPEEARINCLVGMTYLRNFGLGIDFTTGTMTLE